MGFGTFQGVYLPCILGMFGAIMYLRLGWMVGNVGVLGAIIIVSVSMCITLLTGLSMSAIATNMKVRGGGTYYMVSRALGLEAGAAIGIPLYIGQALAPAFYLAGFAESITHLWPGLPTAGVSVLTLTLLVAVVGISADFALKVQGGILVILVMSLISFFAGAPLSPPINVPQMSQSLPFWAVFAVFFPAVTGIESGVAMSGELKNPARSLPIGLISAILTAYVVFLGIILFLYWTVPAELLLNDSLVMQKIAWIGELIILGIWGATLSSAIGALLGAPRTLQALAQDRIVPSFLGKTWGAKQIPYAAITISFLIALVGSLFGELNTLAPILTTFFLTAYVLLNLSAALDEFVGNPSWRPRVRVPWGISFAGALGALGAMLMIDASSAFLSLGLGLGLYTWMMRRAIHRHWDDLRQTLWTALAHQAIYHLSSSVPQVRSWRPHLLVCVSSPTQDGALIRLAEAMTQGKGLLIIAVFAALQASGERLRELRRTLRQYLHKQQIRAIVHLELTTEGITSAQTLLKVYGFERFAPNTILLRAPRQTQTWLEYVSLIETSLNYKKNLLIICESETENTDSFALEPPNISWLWKQLEKIAKMPQRTAPPRIDLWCRGQQLNIGLMLALAHLLQSSLLWKNAKLVLRTLVEKEKERESLQQYWQAFLQQGRLDVHVEINLLPPEVEPWHLIQEQSQSADLVLLGLRPPHAQESPMSYALYLQNLHLQTAVLAPTLLVLASEDLPFIEIFNSAS